MRPALVLLLLCACAPTSRPVPSGPPPLPSDVAIEDGQGELNLWIPDGTTVAQLHLYGAPLDVRLEVATWDAPGVTVVSADAGRPLTEAERQWTMGTGFGVVGPCRTRAAFGAAAFLCPNTPQGPWGRGDHFIGLRAMRLVSTDGGRVEEPWTGTLQVNVRLGTERPTMDRELPLHIHMPSTIRFSDEEWDELTARTRSLLLPAGVVPTVEVRGCARTSVTVDALSLRSPALAALSECGSTPGGIGVYLVESLETLDDDGNRRSVASLVTSLPLAVGERGVANMIVMRAKGAGDDPVQLGTRLAHEVGHALGLFHLVELPAPDGTAVVDLINDTPEDVTAAVDYLMHHTPLSGSAAISDGQQAVIRRHPALQ